MRLLRLAQALHCVFTVVAQTVTTTDRYIVYAITPAYNLISLPVLAILSSRSSLSILKAIP
jgi:hypothetical protein